MPDTRPPDRSQTRRALLGVFIVLCIVAIAGFVISLDEIVSSRSETVEVHAELPETDGLVPGAEVWIAGHAVGEVLGVTLRTPSPGAPGRVRVTARIPRDRLPLLRTDSRARLASARLLGPPVLELVPGSAGAPPLEAGGTIPGAPEPDVARTAVAAARALLPRVDTLMTQLRASAALYRERQPDIDALRASAARAAAELEQTRSALESGPFATALSDAELSARIGRIRGRVTELRDGLGRYAGGELGTSVDSLRSSVQSLREEIAALDSAAAAPRGFIGRMAADSAIRRAAAGAGAQLDSLTAEAMANPLIFF